LVDLYLGLLEERVDILLNSEPDEAGNLGADEVLAFVKALEAGFGRCGRRVGFGLVVCRLSG
jgi:hypothetical protein